ncbi:hypothetical protein [Confluentibacter flavum]|uniref:hypothetical protein n=1 Tax=Confluentibacter flavum TaxID=1909700 RepID=UPI0012FE9B07|nr:hypothetical protein [Confluentibacter flavum]
MRYSFTMIKFFRYIHKKLLQEVSPTGQVGKNKKASDAKGLMFKVSFYSKKQ